MGRELKSKLKSRLDRCTVISKKLANIQEERVRPDATTMPTNEQDIARKCAEEALRFVINMQDRKTTVNAEPDQSKPTLNIQKTENVSAPKIRTESKPRVQKPKSASEVECRTSRIQRQKPELESSGLKPLRTLSIQTTSPLKVPSTGTPPAGTIVSPNKTPRPPKLDVSDQVGEFWPPPRDTMEHLAEIRESKRGEVPALDQKDAAQSALEEESQKDGGKREESSTSFSSLIRKMFTESKKYDEKSKRKG